jgi:hypothetical protein
MWTAVAMVIDLCLCLANTPGGAAVQWPSQGLSCCKLGLQVQAADAFFAAGAPAAGGGTSSWVNNMEVRAWPVVGGVGHDVRCYSPTSEASP